MAVGRVLLVLRTGMSSSSSSSLVKLLEDRPSSPVLVLAPAMGCKDLRTEFCSDRGGSELFFSDPEAGKAYQDQQPIKYSLKCNYLALFPLQPVTTQPASVVDLRSCSVTEP